MKHPSPAVPSLHPRALRVAGCSALLLGAAGFSRAAVLPPTDNTGEPYMALYAWGLDGADQVKGGGITNGDYTAGWLYRSGLYTMDFLAGTWANIEGNGDTKTLRAASMWHDVHPGGRLLLAVGMLPADNGASTLASGALGNYDSHFATLATNLVDWGLAGCTTIRLGHEFNGFWYPWSVATSAAAKDYAKYYQKIVTAMRAVPGAAGLKFEWCGAIYPRSYALIDAYPGNAYVDYVGVDIYDRCYAANTYPLPAGATDAEILTRRQNAWAYLTGNTNNNLGVWKNFAAAQGRPFVIPEWGVSGHPESDGMDNPYFVQKMYELIHEQANGIVYHGYFDIQKSDPTVDGRHRLTQLPDGPASLYPQAAAMFRRLFAVAPFPLDQDVGAVGLAGSGKVEDFVGAGLGYRAAGTSDAFHFSSRSIAGDDELRLKITAKSAAAGAQSGAMLRQSTATNSAYAALYLSDGKCAFQLRSAAGAAAAQTAVVNVSSLPVWLRLARRGGQVSGYISSDGLNWARVDQRDLTLTGSAQLGAAISSGSSTATNATVITEVDRVDFETNSTSAVQGAIILDNDASGGVAKTGTWDVNTTALDRQGNNYLSDGNAGKGSKTVRFSPALPSSGVYDVFMRWPVAANRAHTTPVTVSYQGGTLSLEANQQSGQHLWNRLGAFSFAAGTSGNVLVGNAGTVLYVMADAVMFTRLPEPSARSPLADAHVQDGTYANSNYGSAAALWVKGDVSPYNRNAFLRFDVSGLAAAKLVMLELTPASVGADAGALHTVEFVSDDTWTEGGVTWANKPAGSGVGLGQLANLQVGAPVAIDLTARARAEAGADGLLSVRIYSNVSGTGKYATFGSKENGTAAWRPRLLVQ